MNWLATIWAEARRGPALALLWVLAAALVAWVFVTGSYLIAVLHFAAIYVVFIGALVSAERQRQITGAINPEDYPEASPDNVRADEEGPDPASAKSRKQVRLG